MKQAENNFLTFHTHNHPWFKSAIDGYYNNISELLYDFLYDSKTIDEKIKKVDRLVELTNIDELTESYKSIRHIVVDVITKDDNHGI